MEAELEASQSGNQVRSNTVVTIESEDIQDI